MVDIKEFFKRDKFAEHCGMELVDVSPGSAKAEMMVKKEHLNGLNTVHGGALFTLADLALDAANSYGMATMAINVSITYMTAVIKGKSLQWLGRFQETPSFPPIPLISSMMRGIGRSISGLAYQKRQSLDEFI